MILMTLSCFEFVFNVSSFSAQLVVLCGGLR